MVEFVNVHTGNKMYVHESRVQEYISLGHKLVPVNSIDAEFVEHEVHEDKPVEKKKRTRKKKVEG